MLKNGDKDNARARILINNSSFRTVVARVSFVVVCSLVTLSRKDSLNVTLCFEGT